VHSGWGAVTHTRVKVVGIIPARYASTRFPGKPLALICGKPLLQWVVERCQKASTLSEVLVATDDERIRDAVKEFCRVEMTASNHPSGSDRIAEVAARCPERCQLMIMSHSETELRLLNELHATGSSVDALAGLPLD